jgi:hypothetical protein
LQVLCERLGRHEEAERYADLARRCWSRAESRVFQAELAATRGERLSAAGPATGAAGGLADPGKR